jgi:hypothetical protein
MIGIRGICILAIGTFDSNAFARMYLQLRAKLSFMLREFLDMSFASLYVLRVGGNTVS